MATKPKPASKRAAPKSLPNLTANELNPAALKTAAKSGLAVSFEYDLSPLVGLSDDDLKAVGEALTLLRSTADRMSVLCQPCDPNDTKTVKDLPAALKAARKKK